MSLTFPRLPRGPSGFTFSGPENQFPPRQERLLNSRVSHNLSAGLLSSRDVWMVIYFFFFLQALCRPHSSLPEGLAGCWTQHSLVPVFHVSETAGRTQFVSYQMSSSRDGSCTEDFFKLKPLAVLMWLGCPE